ncbi:hypothetical protein EV122DRAFT_278855 [Schizophyllum commune]
MPLNLESQAVTTRTRKRQKLRDTAVKLKPKKITPFLKTATPIASFARLPPGVLYEIFSHCDPVALVQLTKTSIILRNMLMECPQSMIRLSKQRYTTRTGAPHSNNKKAPIIIWNARIRCCKERLYGSDHIIYEENLPFFKVMRDVRRRLGHAEFRPQDLFPGFSASSGIFQFFMLGQVEKFIKDYERECTSKTKEEKKACIASRAVEFEKIKQVRDASCHAYICELILRRLSTVGLGTDVRHPENWNSFRAHAVVSEPRELTEKTWSQIRDPLLQFFDELWKKRLADERREICRQRYSMLEKVYKTYSDEKTGPKRFEAFRFRFEGAPARCFFRKIGNLATFQDVTGLIGGTPVGQALAEEQMGALIDQLSQPHVNALGQTRFDAWCAGYEAEPTEADPARKARATTVDLRLAATVFSVVLARTAWSVEAFKVEDARLRLAEQVIRLAGPDPRTATPAEMDARGAWVALKRDLDGSEGTYRAMMWRYVVLSR